VCVEIGLAPTDTELFWMTFGSEDDEHRLGMKHSVAHLLVHALGNGFSVSIEHSADSAEIGAVTIGGSDISPIGHAVWHDAYTISGSAIPADVEVVFEDVFTITVVTPDLVRPHWIMIAELPASVSPGRTTVRLQAPGFTSDTVPITVVDGPPVRCRVLYPGAPKPDPYTIAVIANPMLELEQRNRYSPDPIMADRVGFFDMVAFTLGNLLNVAEDLLRRDELDSYMRFTAVFDDVLLESNATNALVELNPPNLIGPRRGAFSNYLGRFSERADVAFAVAGSTTHTRASARLTADDTGGPATPYTYDAGGFEHQHFYDEPGVATLSIFSNTAGLTPLHEFGHAASAWPTGAVLDQYVDGGPTSGALIVNKKWRANVSDAVPGVFGAYNGTDYNSDAARDGLGYPATWRAYHPQLSDPARPNLMDNYWLAPGGTFQQCRLDRLTYDWFSDRLRAKVFR
jgi:hypothetical protein